MLTKLILVILVIFVVFFGLKYNKGTGSNSINVVNTFPGNIMDNQHQSRVVRYSVEELVRLRSVPRQLTLPDQDLLTRLKCFGILRYRGKRSGRPRDRLDKSQKGVNVSNLSYPKISNTLNNHKEKVIAITLNCRSLVNKDVIIGQLLREDKVDFALLTETWYSDDKQHQFETCDLNQNGYKISVANRKNRIGGGIALTYRTGVNMRKITSGMSRCFEYGIWKLIFKNITLNILGIYRPPSLSTPAQFVSEFCLFMEETIPKYSNLLILGDFNLHINEETSAISDFKDSLFAMGLEQHVDFSTHVGGNSLDLVITEVVGGVEVLSCQTDVFISDHCVVKIITNVKKENIKSQTVSRRNFKDIDKSAFGHDLNEISIECEDVNAYVQQFETTIGSILDKHAPIKEKN